jgi:hypothetical protein
MNALCDRTLLSSGSGCARTSGLSLSVVVRKEATEEMELTGHVE